MKIKFIKQMISEIEFNEIGKVCGTGSGILFTLALMQARGVDENIVAMKIGVVTFTFFFAVCFIWSFVSNVMNHSHQQKILKAQQEREESEGDHNIWSNDDLYAPLLSEESRHEIELENMIQKCRQQVAYKFAVNPKFIGDKELNSMRAEIEAKNKAKRSGRINVRGCNNDL